MAGHTPGPWMVEDPLGPDIFSIVADGPSKQVYDWRHIAQLSPDEPAKSPSDIGRGETEANARLIAAAPDLLAACKTFLACPPRDRHDIALEDIVAAAVAKAEGKR